MLDNKGTNAKELVPWNSKKVSKIGWKGGMQGLGPEGKSGQRKISHWVCIGLPSGNIIHNTFAALISWRQFSIGERQTDFNHNCKGQWCIAQMLVEWRPAGSRASKVPTSWSTVAEEYAQSSESNLAKMKWLWIILMSHNKATVEWLAKYK